MEKESTPKKKRSKKAIPVSEKHMNKTEEWQRLLGLMEKKLGSKES